MKWLGAILLIGAAYWGGTLLAREEEKKLCCLEAVSDFLSYIKRRISGDRAPLYELYTSFDNPLLENLGFLPILRSHRKTDSKIWREAVEVLPVSASAKKELLLLGNRLGLLNLPQQERAIELCREAIAEELKKEKDALPVKQKTIKTLFLLFGSLLAILLL